MKLLLTGIDGYIGSVLAPLLIEHGHDVTGADTGFYRDGWLFNDSSAIYPKTLNVDIRKITASDLEGFDAVIHLAELSNDPLGENNPEVTFDINHRGSISLANAAKAAGVERFIYTSSCSVYGIAEGVVDEQSATSPQTAYAKCKVLVERDLLDLADASFSPTMLRNATAYGASPRMRFDIVLNNLAGLAWTTGKIAMSSDGTPWRPLVHIRDIATAILCSLGAPRDTVHGQIFNVGSTSSNYQIREIAQIVGSVFTGCEVTFGPPARDDRSYNVNFDKIQTQLPGFECQWDAEKGAEELYAVFNRIQMTKEQFEGRAFTRLEMLKHLSKSNQIDENLFWRST